MTGGIYEIRQIGTNRRYVGSAGDFAERWKQHLTKLRGKRHHNKLLQHIFNKHGESSLEFVVVEECQGDVIAREQVHIDRIWGAEGCMNICPTAGKSGRLGIPHTPETRAKISARISGIKIGPPSAAKRAKIAASNLGKKRSDETRARQRESAKGRKMPPKTTEHQEKISAAMRAAWVRRKERGDPWTGNQYRGGSG